MNKLVFDIGASNVKYAVMTDDGEIVSKDKYPTPRDSYDEYFDSFVNVYEQHKDEVDGIAFSTNGRMYPDGVTYKSYTMDFLKGVNLKAVMEERTGVRVSVENDGFAAAIGEWWKGAGKGCDNVLGVVLGSGIGGGVVLNGKVYRGAKMNAVKNFLMTSSADLVNNKYGNMIYGCFAALYFLIAMEKQIPFTEVTGEKVFEWAKEGDPVVNKYLELYYRSIALSIENCNALFDLDCVVLTGGIAAQPAVIEGVKRNYEEITTTMLNIEGLGPLNAMSNVLFDVEDLKADIRQGELTSDANLYGALYTFLHG